jgi:predicted TIM-barrel fold metal-dependent hydrolase
MLTRPLPFPVYDADNHIYEPEEAFLRHLPKKFERDFYFVTDKKGHKKLVIDGALTEYIPNPTFEVVSRPGGWEKYFRANNPESLSRRELAGPVVRPPPEWRTGEGRVALLDEQQVHAALVFPTLASVIEERLGAKADTTCALFHALNLWVDEEWGFAHQGRLFSVPFISLTDVDEAVAELEFVLKRGARSVAIRPAPVPNIAGSRSFGYQEYDPFWARVNEAGIFVCLHGSDTGYDRITRWWRGSGSEWLPFQNDTLGLVIDLIGRPISDSVAALICHGVFARHPNVRVASIENGATWVESLLRRLGRAYGQSPNSFKEDPRDTFHRHIFVAPFYEDDVNELRHVLPIERTLFGSDFPHPEGVAEPLQYLEEFTQFSDAEVERVFSANLKGLLEGVRD